jgi:glycosyltransferase involved in cell wall biosynthesis
MKICLLTRSLSTGGMETQLFVLVRGLARKGHDVVVIVFYAGGDLEKYSEIEHLKMRVLGKRSRWRLVSFIRDLLRAVREEKPDVLHSYLTAANILSALMKPFLRPLPIIWGIRSSLMHLQQYDWFLRLTYFCERRLSRFADCIVVNSAAGIEYARRNGFGCKDMVMIPNGIDTDQFRPDEEGRKAVRAEWGLSEDQKLVGLVGRVDPVKDHPSFLRAAALLRRKFKEVRFACIGPSGNAEYSRQLNALEADLELEGSVIWEDARMDMCRVYNAFDLAVSASRAEGFSNVIAEAMACGIPCVVTDVGDSSLMVGDCGMVVPPGNPERLALAWEEALQQDKPRDGRRSRSRIIENFSVERLVLSTEEVFFRMVADAR